MKLGIFDSGIGGLSVLKNIVEERLFDEIIYYGDTARVPYGTKSKSTIIQFSTEALSFFDDFNIDMLIVACNTASAYALDSMSKLAKYPIIGVIEAGVLALTNKIKDKNKRILVIATKATINSNVYLHKLQDEGYRNIESIQTGLFVPLVEEGIFQGKVLDSVFDYYFGNIQTPDAIILGCTHFPMIKNEISRYFHNKPTLIHSGEAIVEYLTRHYNIQTTNSQPKIRYFSSSMGNKIKDNKIEEIACTWMSLPAMPTPPN